jgi:hypothetical protein
MEVSNLHHARRGQNSYPHTKPGPPPAGLQAISQAFAKAAVDVFASVSGGPGCSVSGSAKGNADAQARAVADSFAMAVVQLCSGASATQWQRTVADALTRVYATAAVQVACKNGGNAQAAASVVAQARCQHTNPRCASMLLPSAPALAPLPPLPSTDAPRGVRPFYPPPNLQSTLTAIACSLSSAFSQCLCKTPPSGYVYTDTCWTGILSDAKLDATAVAQSNGPDCQALVSGAGSTQTAPTPPNFPQMPGGPGVNFPPGATFIGGNTVGGQTGR